MTNRELIALIERRPLTFVSHHSLSELDAFINGYNYHRFVSGELENIDADYKRFVDSWIYSRLNVVDKKGWKEAILQSCESEEAAFRLFFDLWHEYIAQVGP